MDRPETGRDRDKGRETERGKEDQLEEVEKEAEKEAEKVVEEEGDTDEEEEEEGEEVVKEEGGEETDLTPRSGVDPQQRLPLLSHDLTSIPNSQPQSVRKACSLPVKLLNFIAVEPIV